MYMDNEGGREDLIKSKKPETCFKRLIICSTEKEKITERKSI